jgi:hypothetical protein
MGVLPGASIRWFARNMCYKELAALQAAIASSCVASTNWLLSDCSWFPPSHDMTFDRRVSFLHRRSLMHRMRILHSVSSLPHMSSIVRRS